MFKSAFKIAVRAAYRDPGNTVINLLGLATGFAVFIGALAFVYHERSFDRFFANADRIVTLDSAIPDDSPFKGSITKFASFVPSVVDDVRRNFPEVEAATNFAQSDHSVGVGDRKFNHIVRWADADFFHIFDLDFIAGGVEGWQTRTDIILLDRSMALKLFGATDATDAVGRILTLDLDTDLEVVGIYEDLPANSHFSEGRDDGPPMGMIASLALYERMNDIDFAGTNTFGNFFPIYMRLADGLDRQSFARDLMASTLPRLNDQMKRIIGSPILVPLTDIHTDRKGNQDLPALQIATGTGLLILVIAIINTVSLNTARMIGRSREISLRRIVGAGRRDLIVQLFTESAVMTALAMLLAIGLLFAVTPWLAADLGYAYALTPFLRGETVLLLFGIGALVAILSISYPVALLSGLSRGFSLGRSLHMGHSAAWIRKFLAVIQFTAVTALVLLAIAVTRQNNFLVDQAPDLNAPRVVTVHGLRDDEIMPRLPTVESALQNIPGVETVSRSAVTPFSGGVWLNSYRPLDDTIEAFSMQMLVADDRFLPLYGIGLRAGRNFDRNLAADIWTFEESLATEARLKKEEDDEKEGRTPLKSPPRTRNVIINETAVNRLGLLSPAEAIGKTFLGGQAGSNTTYLIIGVAPDINLTDHDSEIRPAVYEYLERSMGAFSVLFSSASAVDIEAINAVLSELVPAEEPEVSPLEETMSVSMQDERRLQSGFLAIATIAIILAATGLYALAAFLATSKRREMGIRKVMGARSGQLVQFMVWQFSRPVALSLLIGIPAGWWMMGAYLERFTQRIEPGAELVFGTAFITALIILSTVISHAVRAARTRPAEVLRHE